jgi:plasmid stabilization system protein ParE
MNVRISAEAEADLERIGDFIAQHNPQRALSFLRELRQHCESLAEMPQAFPLVPRYDSHGLRRRVCGNYLIFYRIGPAHIDIIHILQGAMDYERLLFPQG